MKFTSLTSKKKYRGFAYLINIDNVNKPVEIGLAKASVKINVTKKDTEKKNANYTIEKGNWCTLGEILLFQKVKNC